MHLESPWNLKWKFKALKVLENCSRCWKVVEFRCLLYPTQILTCLIWKTTFRIKLLMLWLRAKKDIDWRAFFAQNGVLEKWEMCLWKVLEFLVQKGYEPWIVKFMEKTSIYRYVIFVSPLALPNIQVPLYMINF